MRVINDAEHQKQPDSDNILLNSIKLDALLHWVLDATLPFLTIRKIFGSGRGGVKLSSTRVFSATAVVA